MTDWRTWHAAYADPGSDLSRRLLVVQDLVRSAVDQARPGPINVASMCAGQGHDLIGVLREHPRRDDVRGVLVELDAVLAASADAGLRQAALLGLQVVVGDAGITSPYRPAVPADLLLACGVFGNVSDADVQSTVEALPSLLAAGATVVWTRHRREPDRTPSIRGWFADAGFEELAFVSPGEGRFSVGAHRLVGEPKPYRPGERLFSFVR